MNENLTRPSLTFEGREAVDMTEWSQEGALASDEAGVSVICTSLSPQLCFAFTVGFILGEASFLKSFNIVAISSQYSQA